MIPSKRNENLIVAAVAVLLVYCGVNAGIGLSQDMLGPQVLALVAGVGVALGLISFAHAMLQRLAAQEAREAQELDSDGSIFDGDREDSQIRRRNLKQFEKYFVPGATIAVGVAELVIAIYLFRIADEPSAATGAKTAAAVALLGGVLFYLVGSYLAGIAYDNKVRVLRLAAGELVGLAYLSGLGGVVSLLRLMEQPLPVERLFVILVAVLLLLRFTEKVLGTVLELYRPRHPKEDERLLYESRINALFAQPRGILTNVSETLNYQFGIRVTEASLRRFGLVILPAIIVFHIAVLGVFSCFVIVNSGEKALLERWGRPHPDRHVLEQGVHLKLPWPIEKVYRRRVDQVRSLTVGTIEEEQKSSGLWKSAAAAELPSYLTANSRDAAQQGRASFNIVSVETFVQYRISNLADYLYRSSDTDRTLGLLARRELTRFLARNDLAEILADGRAKAETVLAGQIQIAADKQWLGVEIVAAGLNYVQPPVDVIDAYQAVVAAEEQRASEILQAEGEYSKLLTDKRVAMQDVIGRARSYRDQRIKLADAGVQSYEQLLPLYRKHKTLFRSRAYFDLLDKLSDTRKIILATDVDDQVIKLDLKKTKSELFDFVEDTQ